MLRLLLVQCLVFFSFLAMAKVIDVKNIDELKAANKQAQPGDLIILQSGDWKDVSVVLDCNGTAEKPITFKADKAGEVFIVGNSKLKLGGTFIVVDGLNFKNGYAGSNAVIDFRINKDKLANDCRVTNCVINDFNNPQRMDENYWVSFSGKRNRIDHCTFLNKKNMGVLIAVILEDDRSRENFHSIDHNYFGKRPPLASNSGEIIRVGVSQHCEFNSNTQIVDNYFYQCDGETEIVSIKSCSNVVRGNLFKECQGGVVLRHGNYNTVENNIFLGNNKEGTGGVRIINKGQWVVNNLFYKCRGEGFRSPLSIMNGVPNSPAFRYVPVTDAVVMNNSFYNCTPISLCEGSDTERSVAPNHVVFQKNIFYNNKDKLIYNKYDDISGIQFADNRVSSQVAQPLPTGFMKSVLVAQKTTSAIIPKVSGVVKGSVSDSLMDSSATRLQRKPSAVPGFSDANVLAKVETNAYKSCGAKWFVIKKEVPVMAVTQCKNAQEVLTAIDKFPNVSITLTGNEYVFDSPIVVTGIVALTATGATPVEFSTTKDNLIELKGNGELSLNKLTIDLTGFKGKNFITTDLSGSSNHSVMTIKQSKFSNLVGTFFQAAKSSVLDSMLVTNCIFQNNKGTLFNFDQETDKKGYYNVEQLKITGNTITAHQGKLLDMLRSGNDESTMGPLLIFNNNKISNAHNNPALISLNGIQKTFIEKNTFTDCNTGKVLVQYADAVRSVHLIQNNTIVNSGTIATDKFVTVKNNTTQ